MKVVCIAAYTIRSPHAHLRTRSPRAYKHARPYVYTRTILRIRNLGILSRADRGIYRGLLSDTVTTAHSVAARFRKDVGGGTRGRCERLILFLDQGLL